MATFDIALAQIPVAEGSHQENLARVRAHVEEHGPRNDLVIFPEACLSGFSRPDEVYASAEPLDGPTVSGLCALARRVGTSILIGLAERAGGAYYNTAVLIGPEGVVLSYRKTHLWMADRPIFRAGDALRVAPWRGVNVGLLICYDIEFPEPARALARMGADLILVCNANMAPYGMTHVRAASARAQENQVFLAMANRVGRGRDDEFTGLSMVVAPTGEPLLQLGSEATVASARIDTAGIGASRAAFEYLRDCRAPAGGGPVAMGAGARELQLAAA